MYIHPQGRQLSLKKIGYITRLLETVRGFTRHQDLKARNSLYVQDFETKKNLTWLRRGGPNPLNVEKVMEYD